MRSNLIKGRGDTTTGTIQIGRMAVMKLQHAPGLASDLAVLGVADAESILILKCQSRNIVCSKTAQSRRRISLRDQSGLNDPFDRHAGITKHCSETLESHGGYRLTISADTDEAYKALQLSKYKCAHAPWIQCDGIQMYGVLASCSSHD